MPGYITQRRGRAKGSHTRTRRSKRRALVAVAALAALALALALGACGGSDDDAGSAASAGTPATATIKLGLIPIVDVAPIYVGIEQGFFRRRGIEVEPQLAAGGAAIVPAVVSGDNQIGFSNNVSLIIGATKGLPMRLIAAGSGISPDTKPSDERTGYCTVLASKGGPIRDVADLAGRSVAVNTLDNIGDVTIRAALEEHGVDPGGVKLQEVGFPDMPAALAAGQVDAAWACEPFVTTLLAQGARPILDSYAATDPNLTVASYFTSTRWAEENPDVLERFVAALKESMAYASAHPDAVRAAITEYAKVDPGTARNLVLPDYPTDFDRPSMQKLIDLSVRYGLIEERIGLDELIATS
jgi:NitT/TauT family transport system substrate-binding protein